MDCQKRTLLLAAMTCILSATVSSHSPARAPSMPPSSSGDVLVTPPSDTSSPSISPVLPPDADPQPQSHNKHSPPAPEAEPPAKAPSLTGKRSKNHKDVVPPEAADNPSPEAEPSNDTESPAKAPAPTRKRPKNHEAPEADSPSPDAEPPSSDIEPPAAKAHSRSKKRTKKHGSSAAPSPAPYLGPPAPLGDGTEPSDDSLSPGPAMFSDDQSVAGRARGSAWVAILILLSLYIII